MLNKKKCPKCEKLQAVKNGTFRGKQGYRCNACNKQFVSRRRLKSLQKKLWHQYVWGKQTLKQLSVTFKKCVPVIQKELDRYELKEYEATPQPLVLIADVTFFGRSYGILAFRSQALKQNIYWKEIARETPAIYREARIELENKGFIITGIVLDGKRGVREVFRDRCASFTKQLF